LVTAPKASFYEFALRGDPVDKHNVNLRAHASACGPCFARSKALFRCPGKSDGQMAFSAQKSVSLALARIATSNAFCALLCLFYAKTAYIFIIAYPSLRVKPPYMVEIVSPYVEFQSVMA
jgi:hypothetical protein